MDSQPNSGNRSRNHSNGGLRRRQYRTWMKALKPQIPRSSHQYLIKKTYINASRTKSKPDTCKNRNSSETLENIEMEDLSIIKEYEPILFSETGTQEETSATANTNMDIENVTIVNNEDPILSNNDEVLEENNVFIQDYENEQAHKNKNPKLEKPLHQNLKITVLECMLMVLNYSFRHNLTSVATEDLCKLINKILGGEVINTSMYMLKKIFSSDVKSAFHFYCSECNAYIGEKSELLKSEAHIHLCSICRKQCDIKTMNDNHFYITLPIKQQIISLLENTDDILNLLKHRFNCNSKSELICDIFDGSIYKELARPGNFLSNVNNLSITFNTDGACVFDSVKNSLWPIHFRINELPPNIRFNQCNSMICGLWFGKKEPNMTLFLSNFIIEMNEMYQTAFQWSTPNGHTIESKVILLNCVVDSKAKPLLQNVKQFNGYYGCGYCNHPGVVLEENSASSNQVKYIMNEDAYLLEDYSCTYTVGGKNREDKNIHQTFHVVDRENEQMRKDMKSVEKERSKNKKLLDIEGIKGVSPLINILTFDIVYGFAIDYMHCILLGVTRLVSSLWLDSQFHSEMYYIGKHVKEIDELLLKIKPPSNITRRPRAISERVDWKANEWRSWLLFYSLPCLEGILPSAYIKHHCLLVTAVQIVLQDVLSYDDLENASWYFLNYVQEFQKLYGKSVMNYNVHLLLHIGKCVEMWGPVWCYSAFSFESANGCLLKLVKGTRGVASQIANKYSTMKSVPKILKLYDINKDVLEYCTDLMCYRVAAIATKFEDITLLGAQKTVTFQEDERSFLEQEYHGRSINCSYERMIKKNIMYHAKCYTRRGAKSDDTIVKLSDHSYGVIEKIFKFNHIVVLLRRINIDVNRSIVEHRLGAKAVHIKVCVNVVYNLGLKLINASEICAKCVLITFGESTYLAEFPNMFEKD